MNSLYKKIALICLVSLTANQAIQAVQFSNIGNWIKGNQKKSAALVASVLGAIILASVLKHKFRHVEEREIHHEIIPSTPDYTYITFVNNNLISDRDNKVRMSFKNVRNASELTEQQRKSLERLIPGSTQEIFNPRSFSYLCVVTDRQKNAVGAAICKSLPTRCSKGCIRIDRLSAEVSKAEVFKPIVETGQDIMLDYKPQEALDHSVLIDEITKADGIRPERCIYGDKSHFYYGRSETHGETL